MRLFILESVQKECHKPLKKALITLILLFSLQVPVTASEADSLQAIWDNQNIAVQTRLNAFQLLIWEHYLFNKPDTGFYLAQTSYNFANKYRLKKQMADALHMQGISFALRGAHFKALDYYKLALKLREELGDKKGIAASLNVIGLVYYNQSDTLSALTYFEKAFEKYEQAKVRKESAAPLSNIGIIYMDRKQWNKALYFFEKAVEIQELFNDQRGLTNCLGSIGLIYLHQGRLAEGIGFIERAISIAKNISDNFWLARHYNNVGSYYAKHGRLEEAIDWCKKGLAVAESSAILVQQKLGCICLYEAYKGLNNLKRALFYHESVKMIGDSLYNAETVRKLQQMEFETVLLQDSINQAAQNRLLDLARKKEVSRQQNIQHIALGLGAVLLIMIVALYGRLRSVRRAQTVLQVEKDRSEQLLLNILPAEIAAELKLKGSAIARNYDAVSILFTDFKDFTAQSANLSAGALVNEINHCFEAFDGIMGKYNIEKIKTIGDAYLAAGGLPKPADNAVKNTVLAALELQKFISRRKIENTTIGKTAFEMRVGIHTGPIVAGIVGVKKFQYDIWGDTVNTALSIETAGEVGKVNISQSTYELLQNDVAFIFEDRGLVEVEGKRKLPMWFVQLAA